MSNRDYLEEREEGFIGYCDYCKEPILSDETFVRLPDGTLYHEFCWRQKNTFFDDLFFEEEEEV